MAKHICIKQDTLAKCQDDLADQLLKWEKHLRAKNMSRHTLRAYGADIGQFINFLTHHLATPPSINDLSEISILDFRSWMSKMMIDNKLSNQSRARSLSGVKNFINWLDKEGIMHNPAINIIRSPKIPRKAPRPLFIKQAKNIIKTEMKKGEENWVSLRNAALFTMLYGCGIRIDEALSLNVEDMPHNGVITVMGKGKKERQIPILDIVNKNLELYLKNCPYPTKPNRALFLGARGKRLNQGVAQLAMRQLRVQLDLPNNATPHALRHSFATHLLEEGMNLREIQELLGHKTIRSTQRYADISDNELIQIYNRSHPHAKPKKNK